MGVWERARGQGVGSRFAPFLQAGKSVFVAAEGQALIQAAVELALEFAKGPVLAGSFNFVEVAFISLLDAQQENIVGPVQAEGAVFKRCQWVRRRLTNAAFYDFE
jgi:hypothetical protein